VARRSGRRKHVPHRTCVACRTTRPKRDLVRVVRTPEGKVLVDPRGKAPGRGAYLCRRRACWTTALTQRRLESALRSSLPPESIATLQAYGERLPETVEESAEAPTK
jgi:hypothetical protein